MQSALHRSNCAGQACAERDGCRRYRIRLLREGETGKPHPIADWASFDIEASLLGECKSFVRFRDA